MDHSSCSQNGDATASPSRPAFNYAVLSEIEVAELNAWFDALEASNLAD